MNFSTIENVEIIIYGCGHIIRICDRLKFWTSLTQIRELSHNYSWNMEWSYKIKYLMIKIKSVSNVSIAVRLTLTPNASIQRLFFIKKWRSTPSHITCEERSMLLRLPSSKRSDFYSIPRQKKSFMKIRVKYVNMQSHKWQLLEPV